MEFTFTDHYIFHVFYPDGFLDVRSFLVLCLCYFRLERSLYFRRYSLPSWSTNIKVRICNKSYKNGAFGKEENYHDLDLA